MSKSLFKFFLLMVVLMGQAYAAVVNINKADAGALAQHLNGIGAKKAQAIVEYRKKNGPFKSLDDLKKVPGIGDGILNKNKSSLSLTKGETKASAAKKKAAKATKDAADKSKKAVAAEKKTTQKKASEKVKKTSAKDKEKAKKATQKLKKDTKTQKQKKEEAKKKAKAS